MIIYLFALLGSAGLVSSSQQLLPMVDHTSWHVLLKEFVNDRHRVDYARLKRDDSGGLNDYVASLGQAGTQTLSPDAKEALLINAYNAFTIQWILENYPKQSIWSTSAPFTEPRHRLGGKMVSLNEVESQLRGMGDPRIHAALVCAARSCPPLRREAYTADRLNAQLDDNVREWLADPALNTFDLHTAKAVISPIFKWYREDFEKYPGGLQGFLRTYAPAEVSQALGRSKFDVQFRDYDWGLNDQSELGTNYSKLRFGIDWLRNWFLTLGRK